MICSVATTAPATIACSLSPKKQMVCSVLLEGYSAHLLSLRTSHTRNEMPGSCRIFRTVTGEKAQHLGAFDILPEKIGLILRTYVGQIAISWDPSFRGSIALFLPPCVPHTQKCMYMHINKTKQIFKLK